MFMGGSHPLRPRFFAQISVVGAAIYTTPPVVHCAVMLMLSIVGVVCFIVGFVAGVAWMSYSADVPVHDHPDQAH
jgi:hypothetical protein